MKKTLLAVFMATSFTGMAQTVMTAKNEIANTVPDEVVTSDSTYWTISTLSTVSYVNTTPGAYYNTYKSGGGMLVKFKFKKNNRFQFQLYVQANTYGMDTETWTEVAGSVTFDKDAKGQQVFNTRAKEGIYPVIKNGITTSRPIPQNELEGQHSSTYLWEKTVLRDDPNNIYLLMIDLEEHPAADVNHPSTIDPQWVSKFHIPAKK